MFRLSTISRRNQRKLSLPVLLLMVTVALVVLVPPANAEAVSVVDQQQTDHDGWFALNPISILAQTFTAEHTGPLTKVAVRVSSYSSYDYAYDLRAEIRATSGGTPTSTVLAAGQVHMVGSAAIDWQEIVFTSPTSVVAGTEYALVLSASTDASGYPLLCVWSFDSERPYPGGRAYSGVWYSGGGNVWLVWRSEDWDFCFKTYYEQADITPPMISGVPGNQTLEATAASGAVATWNTPTASDAVDGPVSVISDYTSGSVFPLGTTTVTFTAVDAALNEATASCTITVVDTTAPTVTAPLDITVNATSLAGAEVTFGASATDTVDGSIPESSIRYYTGYGTVGESEVFSGGTFSIGSSTITVTATDARGNVGASVFAITVLGPGEMAANLAQQYQDWLSDGSLAGVGAKLTAAAGKANALGNMLEQVHMYIDAEDWAAALDQLEAALAKCDGDPTIPDFVSGLKAEELAGCIRELIEVAPPVSNGDFVGLDEAAATWHVEFNVFGTGTNTGVGEVVLTSRQALPEGVWLEEAFTLSVEHYFSVQSLDAGWDPDWVDPGAIAGMCGRVVASTGGAGVPGVGEFCYFLVLDGRGPGDIGPDGTTYSPDRWKYWLGSGSQAELRNFARNVMSTLYEEGTQDGDLWPVVDGNIQVRGGLLM